MLLNRIPGVTTRTSCEGAGATSERHRHAELAYVLFRHELPVGLQEFLIARLDTLARVEDDGIFSRWPQRNRIFLQRLGAAARTYALRARRPRLSVHWPLPRLRARFARVMACREEIEVVLCRECKDLVIDPHAERHQTLPLFHVPADLEIAWFGEFIGQSENRLDPALIAADGLPAVAARTQRGDFGATFRRRWLRHRTRLLAALTTRTVRRAIQTARREGADIDYYYTDAYAECSWGRGNE
jgi:hypothetical protein